MPAIAFRSLAAAAIALAFAATAPVAPTAALAQDEQQGGTQQQPQFSDAKLRSFAVAALEVRDIIENWRPRIEGAESKDERDNLRQQANAELHTAVKQSDGISVAEYQQIVQAARADRRFYERLRGIVEDVRQGR